MAVKTGALQFFKWDEDIAEPSYNAGGLLLAGEMVAESALDMRYGVQNQASPFAGPVRYSGRAEFGITADTKALIACALRGAGALTALKLYGGCTADIDILHASALLNRLVVSGGVDQEPRATIEWLALTETQAAAGSTVVALTSDLLPFGGASLSVDTAPVKAQNFEITVENGVQAYTSLDAKEEDEMRLPQGLTVGMEKVSLRMGCLEMQTWDVGEDVPLQDIAALISYDDGTNDITFTFTGLSRRGARPFPFVTESGLVIWQYEFMGPAGALVIA
jgi:hypothetical protein